MTLGVAELFILVMIVVPLGFLLPIWAAVDAAGRPEWAFERAGTSKTLWIVLPIVGIFACGLVGLVSAIAWFASYRSKVAAAAAGDTRHRLGVVPMGVADRVRPLLLRPKGVFVCVSALRLDGQLTRGSVLSQRADSADGRRDDAFAEAKARVVEELVAVTSGA